MELDSVNILDFIYTSFVKIGKEIMKPQSQIKNSFLHNFVISHLTIDQDIKHIMG
jgi:hypothetical protein